MADISFKQINGIQEMMCRYCFIIVTIRLLLLFTSIRTVFTVLQHVKVILEQLIYDHPGNNF